MTDFPGSFNDGETARRHAVTVQLDTTMLAIISNEDGRRSHWPLKDLRFVGEAFDGAATRLKYGEAGLGRLIVDDPAFQDAILRAAPHLKQNPNLNWRRIAGLTFGVAAIAALLYISFPRLVELATDLIPSEWERNAGEEMAIEVAALMGARDGFCNDPAGLAALDELTTRLATAATAIPGADTVKSADNLVIRAANSPRRNAFTLLGGQIIVLNGLLFNARSPDEVAGVIAHEIGHVLHRHPVRNMTRAMGLDLIFEFMLGGGRTVGFGQTLLSLSYSRDAEREADETALAILDQANISTAGLADFLDRLNENNTGWLSTHPDSSDRAAALRAHTAPSATTPALSPTAWRALNGICQSTSKR